MANESEFKDIVQAIRRGGIDALVISGDKGDEVVVLQGAEHPYKVLVENISDGAATIDAAGNILFANSRFAEILGTPLEQLLGARLLDHVLWGGHEDLARMLRKRISGEVFLRTDGEPPRTIRFTLGAAKAKNSRESNICVVATELTDIVRVQEALKSTEQSLGELSARVLSLQDEERRRIARDLHDVTGQSLAVQSMLLWNLREHDSELSPEVRELVHECASLNERMTEEIRTLSYLLHPPLIEESGLAAAVKWYVEGFSARSGIQIVVEADPDFPRLRPEEEIALFRVVQESLTNVHRYSGSSRGEVRLRCTNREIVLEIEDYGKGLRREVLNTDGSKPSLGVGILGMRERVRQLGGSLQIMSRTNAGTVVAAHLPLDREQATPAEASAAGTSRASSANHGRTAKAKAGK
jgi:PAS domain S-box-containing protein